MSVGDKPRNGHAPRMLASEEAFIPIGSGGLTTPSTFQFAPDWNLLSPVSQDEAS